MPLPRLLESIRQNHALEHATIAILTHRHPGTSFAGHSNPAGFLVYGNVEAEEVEIAAQEALDRLVQGESDLALSPFCGTNIIVTGALAGLAAFVSLGGRGQLRRLPRALALSTWAVLASQPLGLLVQRYITTSANIQGLKVIGVRTLQRGEAAAHWVRTTRQPHLP